MRVYVPSTVPALARVLRAGEIAAPVCAFAVTPALREWYASGDLEELEYAALAAAARASLRLLAADPGVPRRRVVIAADVADGTAGRGSSPERAAVLVGAAVPIEKIVSAHLDDPGAVGDVTAAVAALAAADHGDEDARFVVDGAEGHELLWYAVSELPYLLAELEAAAPEAAAPETAAAPEAGAGPEAGLTPDAGPQAPGGGSSG